jgi:hypothetical protein
MLENILFKNIALDFKVSYLTWHILRIINWFNNNYQTGHYFHLGASALTYILWKSVHTDCNSIYV